MKKLQLTIDERNWLLPLLNERMETLLTDAFEAPAHHLDNLDAAIKKVLTDLNLHLKTWEKIMISSCVNEHLSMLNLMIDKPDAYSLLNCDGVTRRTLEEIDNAYNILSKLENGKYKKASMFKERISYAEYFEMLAKLRGAEMIYLSGSNDVSPYKIAFVYNKKEYCQFELRQNIDLHSINFGPLKDDAIKYGRTYFQEVLTRKQAFESLSRFNDSDYREGQLPFLLELLN